MLCLLKAAAVVFLAPALASAHSFTSADVPHALIKLDLKNFSQNVDVQETSLRFDILESDAPCAYGNITLDGHTLVQDEDGAGSGSIASEQGSIIVGNWKFTCVEVNDEYREQVLKFDVASIDGSQVEDVGFAIQFQQMVPMKVSYVDGANVVLSLRTGTGADTVSDVEATATNGLATEVAELEAMKGKLSDLRHAIAAKEKWIMDAYGLQSDSEKDIVPISDCDDVKCIARALFKDAKGMAHKVYEEMEDQAASVRDSLSKSTGSSDGSNTHLDSGMFPSSIVDPAEREHPIIIAEETDVPSTPSPTRDATSPTATQFPDATTSHQPQLSDNTLDFGSMLNTILLIRVFAIFMILTFLITAAHTRCFATTREQRRARREAARLAREERREKQAARRAAIKAMIVSWFHSLHRVLHRVQIEDEEKEAAVSSMQQAEASASMSDCDTAVESGNESDSESEDNLSTTMEQELAQFRAVAGVVGDLVAAEEGRTRARAARIVVPARNRRYSDAPSSPSSSCPSYSTDDESLPAYEEGPHYSREVADGLRYTPGRSSRSSSSTRAPPVESTLDEHLEHKNY